MRGGRADRWLEGQAEDQAGVDAGGGPVCRCRFICRQRPCGSSAIVLCLQMLLRGESPACVCERRRTCRGEDCS